MKEAYINILPVCHFLKKINYEATATEGGCNLPKDRHTDDQIGRITPAINPHVYGSLMFDGSSKLTQ